MSSDTDNEERKGGKKKKKKEDESEEANDPSFKEECPDKQSWILSRHFASFYLLLIQLCGCRIDFLGTCNLFNMAEIQGGVCRQVFQAELVDQPNYPGQAIIQNCQLKSFISAETVIVYRSSCTSDK
jgi:hypothetical protein